MLQNTINVNNMTSEQVNSMLCYYDQAIVGMLNLKIVARPDMGPFLWRSVGVFLDGVDEDFIRNNDTFGCVTEHLDELKEMKETLLNGEYTILEGTY